MLSQSIPQNPVNKQSLCLYALFMAWALFSLYFACTSLSVLIFLKISLFTTPLLVLNIFAIGIYLFMPPKKQFGGIAFCLVWAVFCTWLFVSQFMDDYQGVLGSFIMPFRTFPYEVLMLIAVAIFFYLLFVPFKIISTSIKQSFIVQPLQDYAKGLALPCLAAVSAALFHAAHNADFLTPMTAGIFVAVFVGMALVGYTLLAFALRKAVPYGDISLMTALSVTAWMFLPTAVALLKLYDHPVWMDAGFITLVPLFLYWLFYKRARLVVLYLLISLPLSGYTYWKHQPLDLASSQQEANSKLFKVPALPATALPADAPNVYLIVYDGTPNMRMLDKLNIKGREDLQETLDALHFKTYADTYSVAQVSLLSMSATYNMSPAFKDTNSTWQANSGLAAGFEVFRKNGYQVDSIQQSFMTGTYQHFDHNFPPREFTTLNKADFLYFLLQAIFTGEFQFENIINAGGDLTPYKKELFTTIPTKKRMVVIHNYYPGHTQLSGACRPNEQEIYEQNFAYARDILREDMAMIEKHDPTAIIIAMGDHGSYLSGDCTSLANSDPKKVSELEVMDRFSTLVAIRWPDPARAAKYDQNLTINQDILPTVFAYLYDSPEPLKWKIEPKAYLNGRLVIDNGKFCPVE